MVDMESYAVLRSCQRFGLPMIGLRGISDGAEELMQLSDWTQYLHQVDENLALAVDRLASALDSGALALLAAHSPPLRTCPRASAGWWSA